MAEVKHSGQRAGDVRLCALHRRVKVIALREIRRNGAGQRAAGAVGVGVVDAASLEPLTRAVAPKQVVGVIDLVPALAEHRTAVLFADGLCGPLHIGGVLNGHAGEDLRLGDVRRQDLGQRQELFAQRGHGVVTQQLCAGCCDHDGVHNDVLCAVFLQFCRNRFDQLCRGYHADLDGIGEDVGKHCVELLRQKMRGRVKNVGHAGGVLGGQGRDCAQGKNAVGGHGLDVCLDTGASAGITSGNGQCCSHGDNFLSFLYTARFYKAAQGGAPGVPLGDGKASLVKGRWPEGPEGFSPSAGATEYKARPVGIPPPRKLGTSL